MPKSKKRKANADFVKKKKKVGKKQQADNVTKTAFRTRTVQVASQNLRASAAGSGSDGRSSTAKEDAQQFEQLLNKVAHYNANMRKNALAGLERFLAARPRQLSDTSTMLLRLFERVAPCSSDDSEQVRRALLSLLQSLLPSVPAARLSPFGPLLLVHTASAMTHIDASVRSFSLELLDLWMEHMPMMCVQSGDKLLNNLLLLIAGERTKTLNSSSAVDVARTRTLLINPSDALLTDSARLGVIRRLFTFLELALHSRNTQEDRAAHPTLEWTAQSFYVSVFPVARKFEKSMYVKCLDNS